MLSAFSKPRVWVTTLLLVLAGATQRVSAEVTDPAAMTTTDIVIQLATDATIPIQSQWIDQPPTIIVQFPAADVRATLAERSVIKVTRISGDDFTKK